MIGRLCLRLMPLAAAALLAAGLGAPARAIEPYPGETREAFTARAALDQQTKLAEADQAAGQLGGGFASAEPSSGSGSLGGVVKFLGFGIVGLLFSGWRMSRSLFSASRTIARAGGAGRPSESFEERVAERMRELDRGMPAPAVPPAMPVVQAAAAPPPPALAPRQHVPLPRGPRTFGKRAT